jgi:hypothetical protein
VKALSSSASAAKNKTKQNKKNPTQLTNWRSLDREIEPEPVCLDRTESCLGIHVRGMLATGLVSGPKVSTGYHQQCSLCLTVSGGP